MVNTCAFIEDARQESIDTILALADVEATRRLRWSSPAAWPSGTATSWPTALPEADAVVGFGVPVAVTWAPPAV